MNDSPAEDQLITELTDLVFQAAGRLRQGFNTIAAELGLTPAQALALVNLRGPAPMRDLADVLSCDASNVTGIVDALEKRGLVTRRPDPSDRRVKHVVLTDEGTRRRDQLTTEANTRSADLFQVLATDRTRLRDLLAAVVHQEPVRAATVSQPEPEDAAGRL
ncbi:MarR family winged helix-turn-helix transcriptional regulator [Actinoplanes derwentensis]|uniref:DNA-binding transcriptional regulator, MarR family n=1 Tax=Actinoplanes derwentensis TaxID=113562 RepID=A0A1H1UY50_9ACTN|nr:MarR family transcriptional regulator [Actinoplanes derwentensis]GID89798.1 MarR family transcriptional regulator [Actinoplanes derwentensis]SDS77363.1 DNA-binding transcriptional regulator, MarR family [Actinoplanes derwentensis]